MPDLSDKNLKPAASSPTETEERRWFVMRDLKRANAKLPAYKQLTEAGLEVYTPMKWVVETRGNRRQRVEKPFMPDLLFVKSTRSALDPVVATTPTLQYRFVKGAPFGEPLTVRNADMDRFILAVSTDRDTYYYRPDELTPGMVGKSIRVIGGPLNEMEGRLLSVKGMRKRRLIVELPGMLKAAVEVNPDYIQFI